MDLLMDIDDTRDLVFINGQCPVTEYPVETVAQRLYIRLRTFRNEWFLDTEYGVPYFQRILGIKTTKSAIDSVFQSEILAETGVSRISEFSSTLDKSTRQYSLSFKVIAESGEESSTITITT